MATLVFSLIGHSCIISHWPLLSCPSLATLVLALIGHFFLSLTGHSCLVPHWSLLSCPSLATLGLSLIDHSCFAPHLPLLSAGLINVGLENIEKHLDFLFTDLYKVYISLTLFQLQKNPYPLFYLSKPLVISLTSDLEKGDFVSLALYSYLR